jgi:DNA-binding transcriptional LysR family regulator
LQIERVTGQLLGSEEASLRLAVFSSFAVRWLVPRLPDLQRAHSQLQLMLEMTSEPPVLSDRVADCFISNTNRPLAFSYDLLYREQLFPVCSRQYWRTICREQRFDGLTAKTLPTLTAEQIAAYPLLSTHSIFGWHTGDWQEWFRSVGQPIPEQARIHHFSHMLLALEAARFHQGIALTNDYMLNDRHDADDFIRIPSHTVATGDQFYFAYKTSRRKETGIRLLRHWLIDQASKTGLLQEHEPAS